MMHSFLCGEKEMLKVNIQPAFFFFPPISFCTTFFPPLLLMANYFVARICLAFPWGALSVKVWNGIYFSGERWSSRRRSKWAMANTPFLSWNVKFMKWCFVGRQISSSECYLYPWFCCWACIWTANDIDVVWNTYSLSIAEVMLLLSGKVSGCQMTSWNFKNFRMQCYLRENIPFISICVWIFPPSILSLDAVYVISWNTTEDIFNLLKFLSFQCSFVHEPQ